MMPTTESVYLFSKGIPLALEPNRQILLLQDCVYQDWKFLAVVHTNSR